MPPCLDSQLGGAPASPISALLARGDRAVISIRDLKDVAPQCSTPGPKFPRLAEFRQPARTRRWITTAVIAAAANERRGRLQWRTDRFTVRPVVAPGLSRLW